jgi:hypothetical protein
MTVVQDEFVQEEVSEATVSQESQAPVYDPSKKYGWGADTQFVMNGQEFGLILNTLRAVVSTEEATRILLADKSCQVLEGIMSRGVSDGTIVESV